MAQVLMSVVVMALAAMAFRFIWDTPVKPVPAGSQAETYTGVAASDVVPSERKRLYSQTFAWGRVEVEVEATTYDKRRYGLVRLLQNDKIMATMWNSEIVPAGIFQADVAADLQNFLGHIAPIVAKDFPK